MEALMASICADPSSLLVEAKPRLAHMGGGPVKGRQEKGDVLQGCTARMYSKDVPQV